jgi:TRAP transporter TAXI family solute receptor
MKRTLPTIAAVAVAALTLAACGGGDGSSGNGSAPDGAAGEEAPDQIVFSTYGTGTSTYADLAAVSEGITSGTGTSIRIITSDTAIGRLTPVREGQADMHRAGDEVTYAFEGDYDFASEEWGPQDLRYVWAPTAPHALAVKESAGIDTYADLKGKRIPDITANPSVNNKIEAFLAYGGLTFDDVTLVEMSYSEQPDALKNGEIDALFQQVYGASLFELDSAVPIKWLSMEGEDQARLDAVAEISPSTEVKEFTGGAGQENEGPTQGLWYPAPIASYTESASEDLAYFTVKAINDTYEEYKDSTQTTSLWNAESGSVLLEPREVPFHEGTVRYLEEEGLWTEEAEERNNELLERGEAMRAGWEEFIAEADKDNLAEEWTAWKEANLDS